MSSLEPPLRIVIVDDHPVVRDGLVGMFTDERGITVVGKPSTARKPSQ